MNDALFQDLKDRVVDTELCLFCGNCFAVCPADCITFTEKGPELTGECISCGQCIDACPGLGVPLGDLDKQVFGRKKTQEEDMGGFGIYLRDRNLVSADPEILEKGYTGGKITTLLAYLLETKEIDAAIISSWGEDSPFPWLAWPMIATSREELIRGTGSKYAFSPVLAALKEAAYRDDLNNIAIVGLSCHLQGLRKLQLLREPFSQLTEKIVMTFGLYCGAPMVKKQDFLHYVSTLCHVQPEEIAHVDFKRVSKAFDVVFTVTRKNGATASKKLNLVNLFSVIGNYPRWTRCSLCTDYTAEYADISFGGVHVTTRSVVGEDLVKRAMNDGRLQTALPNDLFEKMAVQLDKSVTALKKKRNRKQIDMNRQQGKPVPEY